MTIFHIPLPKMLVEIQSYQEGVCFGALRLIKLKRMVGLLKVCLSPGRSKEEMGYLLKSPERLSNSFVSQNELYRASLVSL